MQGVPAPMETLMLAATLQIPARLAVGTERAIPEYVESQVAATE
jgi:hypothetical protein